MEASARNPPLWARDILPTAPPISMRGMPPVCRCAGAGVRVRCAVCRCACGTIIETDLTEVVSNGRAYTTW